jgi:hypothetical protein
MDHGSISSFGQTVIHARSFTKIEDVMYIQSILKKNFDLITIIKEKKLNQ